MHPKMASLVKAAADLAAEVLERKRQFANGRRTLIALDKEF